MNYRPLVAWTFQGLIANHFPTSWWPAYEKPYEFTQDWFTRRIRSWKRIFRDLKGQENLKALEIGTFEGRSALWLLENVLTHATSQLVTIDPLAGEIEQRFHSNLELSGFAHKVQKHLGHSEDILHTLPEKSFDIIYVDGDHTAAGVERDSRLCWRLLKEGGILIFDDYLWEEEYPENERPGPSIDQFLESISSQYVLLHKDYQVVLRTSCCP